MSERLGRRIVAGAAAFAALNLAPFDVSARPQSSESQTIVPGGTESTAESAQPVQDFSRAPELIRIALQTAVDENVPAESRTSTSRITGLTEVTAGFHERDSRGRNEIYEVTAATQGGRTYLKIQVCADQPEERGHVVVECEGNQDVVEMMDYDLNGTVDGVIVGLAHPDLLGNQVISYTRGRPGWDERRFQSIFNDTLNTVARHASGIESTHS